MATKKIWIVELMDEGSQSTNYGFKKYETVDSAIIAAKQKQQGSNRSDPVGVFELVQITTPIVPDIQVSAVT